MNLPEGFVLDAPPAAVPEGFTLDQGPGQGEAIARGVQQGVTFNFGDEMRGVLAAGGGKVGSDTEPAGPHNLLIGAYKLLLSGDPEAKKLYDATVASERERTKAAQEKNPASYAAGNVLGAVAVPLGGALNAATLLARIGRGAMVGAGAGALAGAGQGETATERGAGAVTGGGIGAVAGAAAPVVLRGAEAVGRGIAAAAAPITNRIRGAANPEAQAARTAVEYLGKGAPELTSAEFGAAQSAGLPVANIERGGEAGRALARWAANVSPEARDTIQKFADARFEGQGDRAITFLQNIAGTSGNTTVLRDSLRGLARIENRPAYNKAYSTPAAQGMWDEGFEQIAQAPVVQNAIRAASVTGANRGTIDGFPRIRSPFVVDKQTGALTLRVDENGNRVLPNLQFWDHVKRNLDKIDTPEARALNDALKSHLDDLVPDYKTARAGAAKFFGAEDAMDAGQKFVHQNMAIGEAAKALSKMTPHERDMFKIGFASKLIDDIGNTRDRVNVMARINNSPNAKAKLGMVLGPNGHRQLEALMSVEQSMDKLRTALGNSTTVRQWIELGLAGGVGGAGVISGDPSQIGLAAAIAGRRYVDQKVAREVARMLTSNDPSVLSKGVKAVAGSKNLLRAFRDLDARLSNVGGQQSAPASIPGIARAEGEQPTGGQRRN